MESAAKTLHRMSPCSPVSVPAKITLIALLFSQDLGQNRHHGENNMGDPAPAGKVGIILRTNSLDINLYISF